MQEKIREEYFEKLEKIKEALKTMFLFTNKDDRKIKIELIYKLSEDLLTLNNFYSTQSYYNHIEEAKIIDKIIEYKEFSNTIFCYNYDFSLIRNNVIEKMTNLYNLYLEIIQFKEKVLGIVVENKLDLGDIVFLMNCEELTIKEAKIRMEKYLNKIPKDPHYEIIVEGFKKMITEDLKDF